MSLVLAIYYLLFIVLLFLFIYFLLSVTARRKAEMRLVWKTRIHPGLPFGNFPFHDSAHSNKKKGSLYSSLD